MRAPGRDGAGGLKGMSSRRRWGHRAPALLRLEPEQGRAPWGISVGKFGSWVLPGGDPGAPWHCPSSEEDAGLSSSQLTSGCLLMEMRFQALDQDWFYHDRWQELCTSSTQCAHLETGAPGFPPCASEEKPGAPSSQAWPGREELGLHPV